MRENDVGVYHIVPSLQDAEIWFIFCPGGHEKKFRVTERGHIIEFKGNPLWKPEKQFIKRHFGI
jgi:hypothetical protein